MQEKRKSIRKRRKNNRLRFFGFMIVFLLTVVYSLSQVVGAENKEILVYETHQVQTGETLWELSSEYAHAKNMDVREVIYMIKKANDLSNSGIQVGETIYVPVCLEYSLKQ